MRRRLQPITLSRTERKITYLAKTPPQSGPLFPCFTHLLTRAEISLGLGVSRPGVSREFEMKVAGYGAGLALGLTLGLAGAAEATTLPFE